MRRLTIFTIAVTVCLFSAMLSKSPIASAQPTSRLDHGIPQVWVPNGCFTMGVTTYRDKNFDNAVPAHHVCLTDGYWMDQYDVTNAAYQAFIDAGGYSNKAWWSAKGWAWLEANYITAPQHYMGFDAPQQPRVGVSWYEAEAYANWRGGSLPSEAQWEYAARGSSDSVYPWGDKYIFGAANIDERPDTSTYLDHTTEVGHYFVNKSWVGAYDMAGNVWQWTADWYADDYYAKSPNMNPLGPSVGAWKTLRGGSWGYDLDCAMTAYRYHTTPVLRNADTGFRIITPPSLNSF